MRKLPVTLKRLEAAWKADIERMRQSPEYFKQSIRLRRKQLKSTRERWRRVQDRPIVQQMVAVVEEMIRDFESDFYDIDLEMLEADGFQHPFVWWVRDSGTDLAFLDGTADEVHRARCVVDAIRLTMNGGQAELHAKAKGRLYYGDPQSGTLLQLKSFKQIQFGKHARDLAQSA